MARVVQLTPTFCAALDTAGIVDASSERRRVVRAVLRLAAIPLPPDGDAEALLPWPGGLGWVHAVPELGLWLQYRFDDDHLEMLAVWTRPPVMVDE